MPDLSQLVTGEMVKMMTETHLICCGWVLGIRSHSLGLVILSRLGHTGLFY